MTIRVLVVDDHAVVRSGLRRVLDADPGIEMVAEAADAERAVFEAIQTKPTSCCSTSDAWHDRGSRSCWRSCRRCRT